MMTDQIVSVGALILHLQDGSPKAEALTHSTDLIDCVS